MPEPRPAPPPRSRPPAATAPAPRARSRDEGKARASRNALKHGLTAMHHLVLEDEVPDALEALIATVAEETGAASEIEARLARRLAIALWKGERAERIETALFDAAPKLRPPQTGFQWEEADPLTTFDVKRFNAIRGYQAQQGREISRCLKELRLLRKEALAGTGRSRGRGAKLHERIMARHGRTRAALRKRTRAAAGSGERPGTQRPCGGEAIRRDGLAKRT